VLTEVTMTKTGADLSHHQATFDAARYFAGEAFIFLKATEGGSFVDPAFRGRWQQVGARPRGAYHFARPGGATVDAQADHFIAVARAAGWRAGDVWVLDLEDAGGVGPMGLSLWADRWCSRVRAALGGPGLFYTYPAFWHATMGNPAGVPGGAMLWWAEYDQAPDRAPAAPHCWQYTSQATVAGVSGPCDHNRMTDAAFQALFGAQEDDMPLNDADKQWIKDRLEESERRVARYVDHGDAVIAGSANHHVSVRSDLAQLAAKVDALKVIVDGIAVGRLEGDVDVTGLLHFEAPPPPVADVPLPEPPA